MLQSAPWFANVQVEIERDRANPQRVPVRIALLERPVADVGLSLGYGTDVGARGEVSFRYRNAFGRGYDMHSAVQVDKTRQIGLRGFLPAARHGGRALRRHASPRATASASSASTPPTRAWTRAASRWRATGSSSTRTSSCASGSRTRRSSRFPTAPSARSSARSRRWARSPGARVDNVLDPTRGGVLTMQVAGGAKAALSDQDFIKTYAQYQHWFALSPVDQLILRAEAGYTIAPSRTAFPRISSSARAARGRCAATRTRAWGRAKATRSWAGATWPRARRSTCAGSRPQWGGALFIDVGDAADARDELSANKGYGVGARWRTPAGPLAIDLAYGDRDRKVRLSFSVSVAF